MAANSVLRWGLMANRPLKVKRCHGLGDVLMLLPVLLKAAHSGVDVTLFTRAEWIEALAAWCPSIRFTSNLLEGMCDLDALTENSRPRTHRTLEFGNLLKVDPPFPFLNECKPRFFSKLGQLCQGSVAFAPEAGHPARQWPTAHSIELATMLVGTPLVLIGQSQTIDIPADTDLRGRLSLDQLFEVVSCASSVVCMDSGILQVAMSLGTPVLSIFGGIDPQFRILPNQRARVLIGRVKCRPCNKNETCAGQYTCLREITADAVQKALIGIEKVNELDIWAH